MTLLDWITRTPHFQTNAWSRDCGGGGEEDNKIEQLLTEQNQKLDMMNNQLKTIKSNTKRGADEAKGFSDLVTFA